VEVTFAGSPDRVEARLVPERGYAFDPFRVEGLPRRPGARLVRALGLAAAAPVACTRILRKRNPDVVLGGGGFARPMLLAASAHACGADRGRRSSRPANRLASRFVQRLFLAYAIRGERQGAHRRAADSFDPRTVPRTKPGATSASARRAARHGVRRRRQRSDAQRDRDRRVGASGPAVLHLSGEARLRGAADTRVAAGAPAASVRRGFRRCAECPDVVVSRAGGTVWRSPRQEAGDLVPYPHATSDHQRRNTEYFARAGGALIVDDEDAPAAVPRLVAELLSDPERMRAMADAMRSAAKPNAADTIADELIALATTRR
jgi:UDP-N-acetylglucosamine--N-acetylmuramyl-(pentapeptide) pyrophosphoryl-undecaprenol N-acetylglucosamine transferase